MSFAILTKVLSPEVEKLLQDDERQIVFTQLLMRHAEGDAGELSDAQSRRNAEVISRWEEQGRMSTAGAVRSEFTFYDTTLFFFSCLWVTRVTLRAESLYRGYYSG